MKAHLSDTVLITFSDLKGLFLRHRSTIKLSAIVSSLIALVLLLLSEPLYRAEATFKQAGKQSDISTNMREIFLQMLPVSSDSGILTIMQSNELLKDVVETMGLQVKCNPDFFLLRVFSRIWENISHELAWSLSDPDPFRFSNVSYLEEKPLKLFIKLQENNLFQLFNHEKKLIAESKLDQPVRSENFAFTLKHIPKNAKKDRFYKIAIEPWINTVVRLRKKFDVRPLKLDKTILQLSFVSRDRFFAADFVNQVMSSYQEYLMRENEELCHSQLSYLKKRQEELISEQDLALGQHVAYLMEDLGKNGYIGFAQELETLAEPKNLYTSKLFNIDVELDRLLVEKQPLMLSGEEKYKGQRFASPFTEIKKQQVNRLESYDLEQKRLSTFAPEPLLSEIKDVSMQIDEIKLLLQSVEKEEDQIDVKALSSKWISQCIASQPKEIVDASPSPLSKTQLVSYLRSAMLQFERKFEVLNEDLRLHSQEFNDFTGLSLDTAQKLMADYTQRRDNLQAEMKELIYLRDRLAKPDFELSSLGAVINDPVTNELIHKASAIAIQLKDNNNRTIREQERLLESLKTQKSFLSQYIFQTVDLKRLRTELLESKIGSLQERTIDLLQSEKQLLGQKLKDINNKMSDLPEKWRRESLLKLKKEMGALMLQAVAQLAETKSLAQSTFQVTSKPLDPAIPPVNPKSAKILFLSILAAILGGALCYFLLLCKALLKGLPATQDNLKLSGFPVAGSLSRYCNTNLSQMKEADLETLRHTAELLCSHLRKQEALTAVCIGGKYPDYSKGLAELLAMRGLKVLVVQYVFNQVVHPDQMPGLWQYLQGQTEALPVRHHSNYDFLPSGGTTRHSAELMCSPRFLSMLSQVKQKYDVILLFNSADAAKAEGLACLKIADIAIVTAGQEKKEELSAYCDWASKKATPCTTFVCSEEFS